MKNDESRGASPIPRDEGRDRTIEVYRRIMNVSGRGRARKISSPGTNVRYMNVAI
jgi:hypothetical protein